MKIANGVGLKIIGKGNIYLSQNLMLKNVLHVPQLSCNLISVGKIMTDNRCLVVFSPSNCYFLSSNCFQEKALKEEAVERKTGVGEYHAGLFLLPKPSVFEDNSRTYSCMNTTFVNNQSVPRIGADSTATRIRLILLWHSRMGHPSFLYLKHLKPNLFNGVHLNSLRCETCFLAKQTKSQYTPKVYTESSPFNLIHSDIWGPSRVSNMNGCKWFVIFVDDHTRLTWVYLMRHKSDFCNIFKQFVALVQNQFGTTIKTLRFDNGTEYLDVEVRSFLSALGIHHQTSNTYTPQQNGVAECKHRHILEVARAIMFSMNVPKFFWGEAVLTAVYLINRMPSRILGHKTPRQVLLDKYLYTHLISEIPFRIFGCVAYVFLQPHLRSKLDCKSVKCIFFGVF